MTKVNFKFRNETKGAVRFAEVNEDGKEIVKDEDGAVIGGLYVRKSGAPWGDGPIPRMLTVTIEFAAKKKKKSDKKTGSKKRRDENNQSNDE